MSSRSGDDHSFTPFGNGSYVLTACGKGVSRVRKYSSQKQSEGLTAVRDLEQSMGGITGRTVAWWPAFYGNEGQDGNLLYCTVISIFKIGKLSLCT